jgi:hypothetical protein
MAFPVSAASESAALDLVPAKQHHWHAKYAEAEPKVFATFILAGVSAYNPDSTIVCRMGGSFLPDSSTGVTSSPLPAPKYNALK